MNFTEAIFVPFLLIVLGLQAACRNRRQRAVVLLIASLIFYGWWKFNFIFLLLFSSVLDFAVGWWLGNTDDPRKRKLLIGISLVGNLGLLAFFKYTNFAITTLNDIALLFGASGPIADTLNITLPVGISFYTFQTLSYGLDVYRRQLRTERSFLNFFLYVSLFPQLVAGPIVRAADLLPQLEKDFYQKRNSSGMFLILYGLAKKLLLADILGALIVDPVFKSPGEYNRSSLLLAAYAYSFQIFLDFSAYSDIALGIGRLLGLEFLKNFNAPYLATSFADFWRRWHISLSTWFRDYLYYPLGGNRRGFARHLLAVTTVFLVSGLWHGANLTFILWGTIHAIVFVGELLLAKRFPSRSQAFNPLRAMVVFHGVTLAWIFFRSPTITAALDWFRTFARPAAKSLEVGIGPSLALAASLLLHVLVEPRIERVTTAFERLPVLVRAGAAMALAVAAFALVDAELTRRAFIYFQF